MDNKMDNKVEWTPTAKQYFMHLCSRLERALSSFEEAVKRGDPALEENFFFIESRVFDAFSALRKGQLMCETIEGEDEAVSAEHVQ